MNFDIFQTILLFLFLTQSHSHPLLLLGMQLPFEAILEVLHLYLYGSLSVWPRHVTADSFEGVHAHKSLTLDLFVHVKLPYMLRMCVCNTSF